MSRNAIVVQILSVRFIAYVIVPFLLFCQHSPMVNNADSYSSSRIETGNFDKPSQLLAFTLSHDSDCQSECEHENK